MPFVLLFLLALVCLPEYWPQPLAWIGVEQGNPLLFASLTWAGVLVLVLWSARRSRRTVRRIRTNDRRESAIQYHIRGRQRQSTCLFIYYLLAVYVLGWGWTVQYVCTLSSGLLLPGAEILILAPFFITLMLQCALYYDIERELHVFVAPAQAFFSRVGFVLFHLRQKLALIAAPFLVLIVDKGMRRLMPESQAGLQALSMLFLVAMIFIGLPWILRLALGLRPLPAGELRDRLLAAARRLDFRSSNILLWNTYGGVTYGRIANAMVAGIVPWVRYVLLSDRLIKDLTPEEVEAVFGHEIGHVKHRHMSYYLGFLFLSLMVVAGFWKLLSTEILGAAAEEAGRYMNELELVPLVTLAGAYIFIVFGFLSRRCERQADIFGCRAVSCSRNDCPGHGAEVTLAPYGFGLCPTGIRVFINALEKVADINGISRHKPGPLQSWQHSTIARRVEFLQELLIDPAKEPRFQRTVFRIKWALLALLVATFFVMGSTQGWHNLGF